MDWLVARSPGEEDGDECGSDDGFDYGVHFERRKLKISGIGRGIAEEVFRRRQGLMTQVS